MPAFYTPKNIQEAQKDYDKCCEMRDRFYTEHIEVLTKILLCMMVWSLLAIMGK